MAIINGTPNDDVLTGTNQNDTITGGDGHDTIAGGLSSDLIAGGQGDDSIDAGDGDDTLTGDQGNDTLDGGAGQDQISGGEGTDLLAGGYGDDVLHGDEGDDILQGGQGQDRIYGDEGNDALSGGTGDDKLYGGTGDDTLAGGQGNDQIEGGDGADILFGDDGNDRIEGGAGNDVITGGAGQDQMSGGDGRDTFVLSSSSDANGDRVDGGTGGDDVDVLDLTGAGARRLVNLSNDADGDSQSGTVEFLDSYGNITSRLQFTEIEQIIPCFTTGTLIATPKGEVLIETLREGDRVITRDNGMQEIRWIGKKEVGGRALHDHAHLRPVLVRAGALGNGMPERDLLLSPNHRVLMTGEQVSLLFDQPEVLSPAKHLCRQDGIDVVETGGVTYWHILFDNHEVILSNSAWTESFQPGDYSLKGVGHAQRREIFELFPDLSDQVGQVEYGTARLSLKAHEAALLHK